MKSFKFNLINVALISSGVALISEPVLSQEANPSLADETNMEVIQVSGIRGSLKRAQDIKMTETSIVDAISAEDIGKLPDVSIAESLSRLPGVATQRKNGRAQMITIRGLSQDFTTTTLNGRQQVSANDNRAVEYDMYPSELLSGAVVYKTPDAALTSQALGGTVDMQTISPLSHGKRTFATSARYEWNDAAALNPEKGKDGKRFFASYIDQFNNDSIGLALGFSTIDVPTQSAQFSAWGFPEITTQDNENVFIIGGAKPFAQTITLERDAYMGVLEIAPVKSITLTFDVFYTDFMEDSIQRGMEFPLEWSDAELDPNSVVVENGVVTQGIYNNVRAVIRSDAEVRKSDTLALGFNFDYQPSDLLSLEFDIAWSRNDRTNQGLQTYSGIAQSDPVGDTVRFESTGQGYIFDTTVDYTDRSKIKLASPQGWATDPGAGRPFGQHGYLKTPTTDDELTQLKASGEYILDSEIFSSVAFGFQYEDRKKSKISSPTAYLALKNGAEFAELPDDAFEMSLGFMGIDSMLAYDGFELLNNGTYDILNQEHASINYRQWQVNEEVRLGYVMANIDSYIGEMALRGNVGVQYNSTSQYSFGTSSYTSFGSTESAPIDGGLDYDEFLPSLNLSLEVFEQQFVRFAYARTLARPRMDELRASQHVNLSEIPNQLTSTDINNSPWSGKGGNPELKPWIANQFDLSYELYFDEGYFSVAYFYKDLDTFVVTEPEIFDFSSLPIPDSAPIQPAITQGFLSVPKNMEGGAIYGWELASALDFDLFHEALQGFGATFSLSLTDSNIERTDFDDNRLPGLSEDVGNAALYYENKGFSARISARYRSDFLSEVTNAGDSRREFRMNQEETLVDAQISYEFQEGSFKGMTLLLQGTNLTDEPYSNIEGGNVDMMRTYESYGKNFAVGVSYKY